MRPQTTPCGANSASLGLLRYITVYNSGPLFSLSTFPFPNVLSENPYKAPRNLLKGLIYSQCIVVYHVGMRVRETALSRQLRVANEGPAARLAKAARVLAASKGQPIACGRPVKVRTLHSHPLYQLHPVTLNAEALEMAGIQPGQYVQAVVPRVLGGVIELRLQGQALPVGSAPPPVSALTSDDDEPDPDGVREDID